MNLKKKKIFMRRLELFMNTLAGGCFTGSAALLYRDGRIDYTYIGLSVYLLFLAIFVYWLTTYFLIDQSDAVAGSESDNDSG